MDDLCNTRNTLDVGTGERIHDRRIYSYPAGYSDRCGSDQSHPGTKTTGIKTGDAKEVRVKIFFSEEIVKL